MGSHSLGPGRRGSAGTEGGRTPAGGPSEPADGPAAWPCAGACLVGKHPSIPKLGRDAWDLVTHGQQPPGSRAQAAIPRGDTQPSMTPDSPCQPPVTLARAGQIELTNRCQERPSSNSCNTHRGKHEGFERNSTRRVTMVGTPVSQRACPPPGSPESCVFKVDLMGPGSRRRHQCA